MSAPIHELEDCLGEISEAVTAGWVLVGLRSGVLVDKEHFDTVYHYLFEDLMNGMTKAKALVERGVELEGVRDRADNDGVEHGAGVVDSVRKHALEMDLALSEANNHAVAIDALTDMCDAKYRSAMAAHTEVVLNGMVSVRNLLEEILAAIRGERGKGASS